MIYNKATSVYIFCCLILILETTCLKHEDRIVSGTSVKTKKYPFMASIQAVRPNNQFLVCGGTIVKDLWILTAAHCIFKQKPSKLFVYIGSNVYGEGDVHSVDKIYAHPKYDGENHDIGLLKLNDPISPKKAQKIALNKNKDVKEGLTATIIGWGKTSKDSMEIPNLREVKVKTVECYSTVGEILRNVFGLKVKDVGVICTSTEDGAGACKGDSGGPLIYKSKQIGIVSKGEPCATGTPDYFTNVAYYWHWIDDLINK